MTGVEPEPHRSLPVLMAALLACLVVVLYLPAISFDLFLLDDLGYLRDNPVVRDGLTWEGVKGAFSSLNGGLWIPATWISFMSDISLFGNGPAGFHLTNILLHAANMALLLLLLNRMTGALLPSTAAAALVALHPMRVESVAWVAERKDVLFFLFGLLAIACWVRYLDVRRRGWYGGALFCFILGLMSKPVLVTLPLLLLVLDIWPLKRGGAGARALVGEKVPFLIPAAGFAGLGVFTQSAGFGGWGGWTTVGERLGNLFLSHLHYLGKTFLPLGLFPRPQGFDPLSAPVQAIVSALALVLLTWGPLAVRSRLPFLTAGWLWYLAALLPHTGVLRVEQFWVGDRFTYLPHVGLAFALSWSGWELWRRRPRTMPFLLPLFLIALSALALSTRSQLFHWRNSVTLLSRGVELSPKDPVLHHMLATALDHAGREEEALAEANLTLSLDPRFGPAHRLAGILLARFGRREEALLHLLQAETLPDPQGNLADSIFSLGRILEELGRVGEALPRYRRAVEMRPGNPLFRRGLGDLLLASGRYREAMELDRAFLALGPQPVPAALAHSRIGRALAGLGRTGEALDEYALAIRLAPLLAEPHVRAAEALETLGDREGARDHRRRAEQLPSTREPAPAGGPAGR